MVIGGRQHDQHPALVVVVRREDVCDRIRGQVALGVHLDGLALDAHLPFERGADVIGAVDESQAEDLVDRPPDRLLGLDSGQFEGALATVDDPALGVTGEEGRVRRRVIVVEQLEQEPEPAVAAGRRVVRKAFVAVDVNGAAMPGTAATLLGTSTRRTAATSIGAKAGTSDCSCSTVVMLPIWSRTWPT